MKRTDDGDLHTRFAELRGYDALQAPPFAAVAAARAPGALRLRTRVAWRRWALAAAAAALLAVGLARRGGVGTPEGVAPAWTSLTDSLVGTPSIAPLFSLPSLHDSVLDRFLPESQPLKGD